MVWLRGPTHECFGAKRSSHLNVETEPRIVWCGEKNPHINVFSAGRSCLNVETEPRI